MKRMWGVKKVFSFMFLALTVFVLLTACGGGGGGSDGGGGNNNQTPPPSNNATIKGTVAGTTVKAFDLSGNEVASNTATGNPKTFTLNVPANGSYKFYLIENEGTASERVYALYQGTTNVFNIASAVTIDLGFVDTSTGKAVPTNNPLNISGVTSGGENTTFPPSLIKPGLLLFSATSNPSAEGDEPYSIAIDSTYMYVVGFDYSLGSDQWRIEKRNLSDGALAAGFGTGGVITNNPSAGRDDAVGIAIDSTYMYVVGFDSSPGAGDQQWRIEKRLLSTGALDASFGTGGVITNNPSAEGDEPYSIAIDSTYMYVVGFDSSPGAGDQQWRIEKRLLSTGALDASFGTAGVVTNNPGTGSCFCTSGDGPFSIAIDSNYMYVGGWDNSPAIGKQWRIEKRNLSDGALAAGFGTGGVVTNNPDTGGDDEAYGIAIDSTYMYVVGYDNASIDQQWRIEKRNLSDGALAAGFGTGGVVTNNPGAGNDAALSIAIDSTNMYVAGVDRSTGNEQWRIEKRNLSDGALAAGFGTGGVVTNNPGAGNDAALRIAIDSTNMYVIGVDSSPGNSTNQWRIEKRTKGSAFGLADLQGTWNYHMLTAGDASSSQTPGWEYGTITINGSGILNHTSVTRSNGNTTLPGSSTISITLSGIITISTDPLLHGVLSKDKSTLVMTNTTSGGPSGTGYVLGIAQKSGGTFSQSDLTGTWNFHQLWAGDPPGNNNGWGYGTAVIDDSGSTNVTCGAESAGSCGSSFTTTLTIAATGVVSQTGNPDFYGVMSQDKSIIVGKAGRDSGTSYDLIIFQKFGAATFSQSDLTGAWNFHQLWAGDPPGNWNGWGYGPLVIDGSGNAILYCGADSDGSCSQSSATLTIDTSGVVTSPGDPNFHLMMSQDKNMLIGTDGGSNWFSMIIVMK